MAEQRYGGGARLLLADDNKVNRLLLARNLELQGHRVVAVENGLRALEQLQRGGFELLLLDMEMPELDGFGVLERMAADSALREVPVIVTSSLEGVAHVARCLELGADDFLHKPVNPVLLKARIGSSLEKKRLRDQQRELIERFATVEVARDLQRSGFDTSGRRLQATVLFVDIRGFTTLVEQQTPEASIELLNTYYTLMFDCLSSEGGVINQMVGDGLMALFGAPQAMAQPALSAARAACAMVEVIELYNTEREAAGQGRIAIGIGIASGDVVAGYTGTQHRATYTCVGDAVNIAARLEAHTREAARRILVDGRTAAAIGTALPIQPLGPVRFKGKSEAVQVFAVEPEQHAVRAAQQRSR